MDNSLGIWSSATLYNRAIRAKRLHWFAQAPSDAASILDFYQNEGEVDWVNGFIMNRSYIGGKILTELKRSKKRSKTQPLIQ